MKYLIFFNSQRARYIEPLSGVPVKTRNIQLFNPFRIIIDIGYGGRLIKDSDTERLDKYGGLAR